MNRLEQSTIKSLFRLHRAGDYRTLLERTRALLEEHPDELPLLSLAGSACLELQDYEGAINSFQAALAIKPDFAKLHNSLGIAYLRSAQVKQAAESFHNAVRHDPEFAQGWFNLGIAYENRQRLPEAAGYYKKATLLNPVYHQALTSLAKMLWELRETAQVAEYFEKALAVEGSYLPAHLGLMHFLEQSNQHEKLRDAVARARTALGPQVMVRLYEGILADIDGEHKEAKTCLEDITIEPTDAWTRYGERTRLAYLTRICDRLNDTAATYRYAQRANNLSRAISDDKGIDKAKFLQFVENRRRYFTTENISQWQQHQRPARRSRNSGNPVDNNPVFIVGFPRSGTTLLDTLLRGHPGIQVVEESDAVPAMVNRLSGQSDNSLESLAGLSEQDIVNLRQIYFKALTRHVKPDSGDLLIDRFALNTVYAGEIVRIFPQARFLLLLRHPADCVLSCFMQTFYETPANASFFTLEDSAHLYDRVFGLWRQYTDLLQLNVLQVKYEELIADVETTCRNIVDFLGLPWHPGILEHEQTQPGTGPSSAPQATTR